MPNLNKELNNFCENPISESESLKSIKHLTSRKTPGSDGLTANFYKLFSIDITTTC